MIITKKVYENYFGAKTSLTKEDRAYINKKSKSDLIKEALSLEIMVDDKLTKSEIYNLIKKIKKEQVKLQQQPKKETQIDMQDLFETLPDVPVRHTRPILPSYDYTKPRESDVLYYPEMRSHRFPPGSKVIRKEEGMTKQQKTIVRRQIKNEIDYLSELLKKFN